MDANISFSRSLLGTTIKEVKAALPGCDVKRAWVYRYSSGRYEFHFGKGQEPDKFYDVVRASNAYEARAKGWANFLRVRSIQPA